MDGIIDFIVANPIWVIVGIVLIIMLIVGYIADKTDFGHKKSTDKKQPVQNDTVDLDNLKGKTLSDVVKDPNAPVNEIGTTDDLNAPFGDAPKTNVYSGNEDLNVPFGDDANNITGSSVTNSTMNIAEDLNAPFGDPLQTPYEPNTVQAAPVQAEQPVETPVETAPVEATPVEPVVQETVEPIAPQTIEPAIAEPIQEEPKVNDTSIFDVAPQEEADTESAYEENLVPEVITEQLDTSDSSNTSSVSSDDDIWKF